MAKRKCVRCDLTRIYAQFDAKAKKAAPVEKEVVAPAPAPKRPVKKKKVEEPVMEAPEVVEEPKEIAVEEHEEKIEEVKEIKD